MAVLIMHEVIRATRITRVIITSGPPVKLFLRSDKRQQNLYLIWIKFKIVASIGWQPIISIKIGMLVSACVRLKSLKFWQIKSVFCPKKAKFNRLALVSLRCAPS